MPLEITGPSEKFPRNPLTIAERRCKVSPCASGDRRRRTLRTGYCGRNIFRMPPPRAGEPTDISLELFTLI